MTTTAITPPPGPDQDILLRASQHATQALPEQLGRWLADMLQAAASTLTNPDAPYVDQEHLDKVLRLAWETRSLPLRPQDDDERLQNVAKALWETDFPPQSYMPWDEVRHNPQFVRHYFHLARAAMVADDAEHARLFDEARQWYDAWNNLDKQRPNPPAAVVVEALVDWLMAHNVGVVNEDDEADSTRDAMRELAIELLRDAPGLGGRP